MSDYIDRLRKANEEKNAPTGNCQNGQNPFGQFWQFGEGAKKVDFSESAQPVTELPTPTETSRCWHVSFTNRPALIVIAAPPDTLAGILKTYPDATAAEPFTPARQTPATLMTPAEESAIRAWLTSIDEIDPATVAAVVDNCQTDTGARERFLWDAGQAAPTEPVTDTTDDRRTCQQCANYTGRQCRIARPGGLVSARQGYAPNPTLLRRCEGYAPGAGDRPTTGPATLAGADFNNEGEITMTPEQQLATDLQRFAEEERAWQWQLIKDIADRVAKSVWPGPAPGNAGAPGEPEQGRVGEPAAFRQSQIETKGLPLPSLENNHDNAN